MHRSFACSSRKSSRQAVCRTITFPACGVARERETCDGCGESVTKDQMVMENLDAAKCGVQFHVACFHVWDVERQLHQARSACWS